MIARLGSKALLATLLAFAIALPAGAQITTGSIGGTVQDASGGVLPGATVVLVSESKGTKSVPAITNGSGDWVLPNTTPDTYTVEVSMSGFKTLQRKNVTVSGGERVAVGILKLEVGGINQTVDVTAEAPLIQASSGERSFAINQTALENLPINHGNFANFTTLTPGVVGTTRLGGTSQNNIMMDGISAMDTGNNGQMLQMNVESIAEVKVLTQGYQAEYGRSSGLQITAVTKSGTNRFHGSVYDIKKNSDWDANSWANSKNGVAKAVNKNDQYGYSLGGPVGKPGGTNKLFFFYSHEYRPTNGTTGNSSGGVLNRHRFPTAAERAGDFSKTLDNNGALFNTIKDPLIAGTCSATNTTACFKDGGVLGKIPASRLYATGVAILNRYPLPNIAQASATSYNYEAEAPRVKNLTQQPAIRADYQFSPALRFTGKYSGQRARRLVTPGTIPGFNDVLNPYPFITNYGLTVNYTLNSTTFVEATYGFIRNQLAGGGSGGILQNSAANRLDPANGIANLPLIYPQAGKVDTRYYAYKTMEDLKPVWWDGTNINLPPVFGWGGRIGSAPPNQQFPGFLNINRTQDIAISLTKVAGRHTFKAGFYNNHSYKAQNTGAGGVANLGFQGFIDFQNNTNNALDTGFGYSNAALGVFTQYLQQEKLIEGSMIYNNTEFYAQDNWKVNSRLTLDYGFRFTRQQPQYDQFLQMSNFFEKQWSASQAPVFYVAGCNNGAVACSGNARNAKNPVTGVILTAPGVANTAAAIGTPVPGTGNPTNGVRKAGDGISNYSYTWPTIVVAPRVGAAYDLDGSQRYVIRGGGGVFFDRPDGNTVFSIPGFPFATSTNLANSQLQTLGQGLSFGAVPALSTFQYEAKVLASAQWNAGIQMALPWASSVDISYVGNHGYNRLNNININAIDIGAAYLAKNQDPTLGTQSVPGAGAVTTNLLRPYRGYNNINRQMTDFYDTYHSIQMSFNRRFIHGLQFGMNYTLGLSQYGNTGLTRRWEHGTDGSLNVRADQAAYEDLLKDLGLRRHLIKGNFVWDMPDLKKDGGAGKALGYLLNDWQLSGILTAGSAGRYDLGFSYNANGNNVNLTGSPDYGARIVFTGDPGKGCTDSQYSQFNVSAVSGPQYGSVGLESGRNIMVGCPDHTVDLTLARNIRLGGGRNIQIRMDAFNAFNFVVFNGRNTTVNYNSPTDLTIRNSQTCQASGVTLSTTCALGGVVANGVDPSLVGKNDPGRLTPNNAGFGAVNGAQTMRNFLLTLRFGF